MGFMHFLLRNFVLVFSLLAFLNSMADTVWLHFIFQLVRGGGFFVLFYYMFITLNRRRRTCDYKFFQIHSSKQNKIWKRWCYIEYPLLCKMPKQDYKNNITSPIKLIIVYCSERLYFQRFTGRIVFTFSLIFPLKGSQIVIGPTSNWWSFF